MGSIIVVELEYTDHGSWVSSHAKRHRERERERERRRKQFVVITYGCICSLVIH